MGYTNSGLVAYKKLSPNHSGQRTHSIDRITPHCVVGQISAESLGDWFAKSSTQASSNYGIDKDGRVGLYVEEKNRSWCSSSSANDQRAVTIECASDTSEPYAFRDAVYKKLITLCVDICKRNGKKKLIWFGDKDKTLNYSPKSDEMVLTVHRWFANKSCPGNWMYARMGDLASKVTAQLGGSSSGSTAAPTTSGGTNTKFPAVPFLVTVIIDDLNIRTEGSMSGKVVGQTGKGVFTITKVKNGWGKLKSGAGWIYLENASYCTIGKAASESGKKVSPQEDKKEEVKEEKVTGLQAKDLKNLSEADVIKKVGPLFTADQKKTGILASVTAAQFILESGYGKSELAQNANNCFGMKKSLSGNTWAGSSWDGKSIYTKKTGEQNPDGSYVTITAEFRKYPCVEDSIADHSAYLLGAMNGSKQRYSGLKGCADYKKAAQIIKDGGYATSLTYVSKLCEIIERWNLTQYDVKAAATATEQKTEEKIVLSGTHSKYIDSTGTHYISNSGSDENGAYRGGQAGDQTGKEWQMRSWYNRPWLVVLRYPDQKVALKLAQLAIDAALNDKIGYDQGQNRTYLAQLKAVGWEPSKVTVACEADCSAGVCANVTAAGYLLGIKALKEHTGTYTGNMRSALTKAGFKALTDSKYLTSGDYLLPGDILLNDNHHTATNVTIGSKVKKDWNPGTVATPATPTEPTKYYRVRKSWEDKASQIGAYTVLDNAILAVDANPGYAAFDDDGRQVYPKKEQEKEPKKSSFTKYPLTDSQLKKIARLCQQEQGTVAGAKAEASLMANQLETNASRRKKYGTGADGLYNWVRNGGWFAKAAHWMDNGSVTDAILAGVKDVLVNGNRTLPLYVDEHDCFSDIQSISTGSVKDRKAYVQGKTVVKNKYGSTWTFWCFPDSTSDPFGYTEAAYKSVSGEKKPEKSSKFPYLVRISISDLNYRKGPGTSHASYGYIEPGVYTIVGEQDGWGLLKAYAEKRNGWVKLSYTEKL